MLTRFHFNIYLFSRYVSTNFWYQNVDHFNQMQFINNTSTGKLVALLIFNNVVLYVTIWQLHFSLQGLIVITTYLLLSSCGVYSPKLSTSQGSHSLGFTAATKQICVLHWGYVSCKPCVYVLSCILTSILEEILPALTLPGYTSTIYEEYLYSFITETHLGIV